MSSIHNIEDALLGIYVFIADTLTENPQWAHWRRSHNDQPEFTDAEVLTIALMQGCLGCASWKQTYLFIANNHKKEFPKLCCSQRFIARLHALREMVGQLLVAALAQHKMPARVYLLDSKPIPLRKPARHGRIRSTPRPPGPPFVCRVGTVRENGKSRLSLPAACGTITV